MIEGKNDNEALHNEIAKGSMLVFVGQVVGSFTRFFTNLVLTRILSVANYGLFSLGLTVFHLANELSLSGFQYGAQNFVPKYRVSGEKSLIKGFILFAFVCTTILSLILGAGLFVFSGLIAEQIFHKEGLENVLKVLAVAIPLYVPMMLCAFFGVAFLKIRIMVKVRDIIQPLLFLIFAVVLLVSDKRSLFCVLLVYSLSVLLTLGIALVLIRQVFGVNMKGRPARFKKKHWGLYSGTVMFAGFFSMFLFQTDKMILGSLGSLEEIGVYNAAWKLYSFLGLSTIVFNTTFFPIISQVYASGNLMELNNLTKMVGKWIFSVNTFFIMIVVVYARDLMRLFGQEFVGGYPVLIIFGLSWIVVSMLTSTSGILRMTGKQNVEFLLSAVMLIFSIISGIILIKRYGMIGAAISSTVCFTVLHVAKAVLSYRYYGINPLGKGTVLSFIFALLGVGLSFAVSSLASNFDVSRITMTVLQVCTFAVAYSVLMLRFCMTEKDKVFVQIIKNKIISHE